MNEIRRIGGGLWQEYARTDTSVRAHNFPLHKLQQFNTGTVFSMEKWEAGVLVELPEQALRE